MCSGINSTPEKTNSSVTDHSEEKLLKRACGYADRLFKIRLRSEHELREKLKIRDYPPAIIDQTVQFFREMDLINDRRFARAWISSRLKRPFGLRRIRIELKKKEISADIIEDECTEASSGYEELEIVEDLAKHRATKYINLDPLKTKQRLYGYLQRRGFNTNTIIKAIKNISYDWK